MECIYWKTLNNGLRLQVGLTRTGREGTTAAITWYVRDAQGNVMATYEGSGEAHSTLYLAEQHLYGSSRLGMLRGLVDMDAEAAGQVAIPLLGSGDTLNFERGRKVYELTNHLGNVLVTISDKKRQHDGGSGVVDYYTADVLSAQDYFSFGMVMPERNYTYGSGYRYGFNGKENDREIKGDGNQYDFGERMYDPRVGRWLSIDPLQAKYPNLSPYNYTADNPVLYVDGEGKDYGVYIDHITKTIIIKATYHTVKGNDADFAHHGANDWNAVKAQTTYSNGTSYSIRFELTVKEYNSAAERDEAFRADKSGEANKFTTIPPQPTSYEGISNYQDEGEIRSIAVEHKHLALVRHTPAHEIGHTLGLFHFSDGLMEAGDTRGFSEEESKITAGMVSRILNNAGLADVTETMDDREVNNVRPEDRAKFVLHVKETPAMVKARQEAMKKLQETMSKLQEDLKGTKPQKDNLGGASGGAYPPPKTPDQH